MTLANITDAEHRQSLQALATDYISAWSTTDDRDRKRLVRAVYAEDAEFFSSENGDLHLRGHNAITDNIGHVNVRDIQGNGLRIEHTGTFVNHRVARVTWQMLTTNGAVALSGMNVLVLSDTNTIAQDYIFIG